MDRFQRVRDFSRWLTRTLEIEDQVTQSMPDASPIKWHLAHTSWFFETFALALGDDYEPFDPAYRLLFNSYYQQVGSMYARPMRGVLSRPTVAQIQRYRDHVDASVLALLQRGGGEDFQHVIETGLHHEQQHQELILTDLKHMLSCNPLRPIYREQPVPRGRAIPVTFVHHPGGLFWIGHEGDAFAYDNETPRHRQFLNGFAIASRPVTNAEFMEFIDDGGYTRPELWLSAGWEHITTDRWTAPLYWERRDQEWWTFTLHGMQPVDPHAPVTHVSYYEADAYANWTGFRLPTEADWEVVAKSQPVAGQLATEAEDFVAHPLLDPGSPTSPSSLFGTVWEWTRSPYSPYPGYRAPAGPLGEYNGKFMCNQMVLRGGSCATPVGHIRPSYRNFFPPEARWQFSGIRLVKDT